MGACLESSSCIAAVIAAVMDTQNIDLFTIPHYYSICYSVGTFAHFYCFELFHFILKKLEPFIGVALLLAGTVYAQVEQSLGNKLYIGYYNSVAYQAVSTTLLEGCSIAFVPWFLPYTKTQTPRLKYGSW